MIRLTLTENHAAIQALDLALIGDVLSAEQLIRSTWWIAKVDGEVAGYCGARSYADCGSVYLIRAGVLEEFRGRGIHARMIKHRIRWARNASAVEAVTDTALQSVASMRSLARFGFLPYEPAEPWAGTRDVVYWEKQLQAKASRGSA